MPVFVELLMQLTVLCWHCILRPAIEDGLSQLGQGLGEQFAAAVEEILLILAGLAALGFAGVILIVALLVAAVRGRHADTVVAPATA